MVKWCYTLHIWYRDKHRTTLVLPRCFFFTFPLFFNGNCFEYSQLFEAFFFFECFNACFFFFFFFFLYFFYCSSLQFSIESFAHFSILNFLKTALVLLQISRSPIFFSRFTGIILSPPNVISISVIFIKMYHQKNACKWMFKDI